MRRFEILFLCVSALLFARELVAGARSLLSAEPYVTRRNDGAFLGLDLDSAASVIDQRLSAGTPVAVGRSFPGDGEFRIRATSVLYPRPVIASALHRLEAAPAVPADGVVLTTMPDGRVLVLTGPPDASPGSNPKTVTDLDPVALVVSGLAIWGLGGICIRALRLGPINTSTTVLVGTLLLALCAHCASWLQRPAPWTPIVAAGLAAALVFLVRSTLSVSRRASLLDGFSVWSIGPAAVLSVAIARALMVPVTEWDGRFIWLFHGKQLFVRGFLDAADMGGIGRQQPTYPLLTSMLFSLGSSFHEAFNERTAVVIGVLFHAFLVAATGRLAMLELGPMRGALLTSLSAAAGMRWSTEAYADGVLSSLLMLQFLALQRNGEEKLGWLAMACAALTKREGLVLSIIVAVLSKGVRAWKPILISVLPGAIHALFCRFLGLAHDFSVVRVPVDFADLSNRALFILRIAARVVIGNPHNLLAAIGLVAFCPLRTRAVPSMARSAFVVTLCFCAFILLTFLVSPRPLPWHLDAALPRLALHPTMFALLGLFLALRSSSTDDRR